MELQARARRFALSGDRQRRDRQAQRHRTRNPDDAQRPSPRQRHATAGSRCCPRWAPRNGRWCAPGFLAGDALRAMAGTRSSTLPRSRRISAEPSRRHGASGAPRRSRRRATGLRRAADRRRAPGRRGRANRRPARRADPDPGRGLAGDRHVGAPDRPADRRVVRRVRPRGDQCQRGVGGRGRHLDHVAAQPWHASGVRRQVVRQSDCGADDSDSRRAQPLRIRDARAAGPGVPRPDRRGCARPDTRCSGADFGGDRLPAGHRQHRAGHQARPRRRHRRLRGAAAVDRHR